MSDPTYTRSLTYGARKFNVAVMTIYRWIQNGTLPALILPGTGPPGRRKRAARIFLSDADIEAKLKEWRTSKKTA